METTGLFMPENHSTDWATSLVLCVHRYRSTLVRRCRGTCVCAGTRTHVCKGMRAYVCAGTETHVTGVVAHVCTGTGAHVCAGTRAQRKTSGILLSMLITLWASFVWFFKRFLYLLCVQQSACIYTCRSEEGTRSHYRWLWAIMWLLGIELMTSGRVVSALNLWAISPACLIFL